MHLEHINAQTGPSAALVEKRVGIPLTTRFRRSIVAGVRGDRHMYMNRNEAEITLGRADEFESMIDQWAAIQAQNAGFFGATLLQSYANPGRYTLLSRWTDRDASIAAGRRQAFKDFIQGFLSSGIARPTRLTEAYESVFEVDRAGIVATESTAERWIDFTLSTPMVAAQFEERIRQLAEVIQQHAPGVLSVRLRRSVGNDTRYLVLVITTDRAAARGWLLVPEIRAFTDTTRTNQFTVVPPSAEIHHVVNRYAGPAFTGVQPAAAARPA